MPCNCDAHNKAWALSGYAFSVGYTSGKMFPWFSCQTCKGKHKL